MLERWRCGFDSYSPSNRVYSRSVSIERNDDDIQIIKRFILIFIPPYRYEENRESRKEESKWYLYDQGRFFERIFLSFFLILSLSSIESKNCQIKSRGGLKLKATWLVLINARLSLEGVSPSFRERSKLVWNLNTIWTRRQIISLLVDLILRKQSARPLPPWNLES